jgi:hypothetical protein
LLLPACICSLAVCICCLFQDICCHDLSLGLRVSCCWDFLSVMLWPLPVLYQCIVSSFLHTLYYCWWLWIASKGINNATPSRSPSLSTIGNLALVCAGHLNHYVQHSVKPFCCVETMIHQYSSKLHHYYL